MGPLTCLSTFEVICNYCSTHFQQYLGMELHGYWFSIVQDFEDCKRKYDLSHSPKGRTPKVLGHRILRANWHNTSWILLHRLMSCGFVLLKPHVLMIIIFSFITKIIKHSGHWIDCNFSSLFFPDAKAFLQSSFIYYVQVRFVY